MASRDSISPAARTSSPSASLQQLLAMDSEAFVRWAYVTMLGRPVDPEGLAFYLRRMEEGKSRISVLKQLKRSAEGRRFDARLPGLDSAIRQAMLQRAPVIGPVYRWLHGRFQASAI